MAKEDVVDERVRLTVEQAMELLDVKDGYVHTLLNPNGFLVGANWSVEQVRKCIETYGAELAGETATGMGHGVASYEEHRRIVFFATKDGARAAVAS